MHRQLPDKPNIEHLKNQAKALLKTHRSKDMAACELLRVLPRFSKISAPQILASVLSLHECQYAIALSYGFSSWPALRSFLLSQVDKDQEEITMSVIDKNSLSETVDAINDVLFYGRALAPARAEKAALWISSREGKSRPYHGLPAPTSLDYENGARLYTGERVISGAGIGHILGEEASRALIMLGINSEPVREAIEAATNSIETFGDPRGNGFFCCCTCSVALWRHLSVSPLKDAKERIAAGMQILSNHRDGAGKWKTFPFYYTLLALSDLPEDLGLAELHFAAPACERILKRQQGGDRHGVRRRALLEKVLARC